MLNVYRRALRSSHIAATRQSGMPTPDVTRCAASRSYARANSDSEGQRTEKHVGEGLDPLDVAVVAAADEQLHGHDVGNVELLARCSSKPFFRGGQPSQAINQNIGVDENHLRRPLPAGGSQVTGELDA